MADLKWLDEYSGQSTEELLKLEGEYRTDSLVVAFEQALYQKACGEEASSLTEEEYIVLAIEALEREVNNGGYDQFFRNSAEFSPVIVDALNQIGSAEGAELTQRAIAALGLEGTLSPEAVGQTMELQDDKRDETLSECDNTYYASVGDLSRPLLEFIRRNKDRIMLKT